MEKNWNIYKDYYGLQFTKIYWSRLANLYISSDGLYRCRCCHKKILECEDKKSVKEYQKIQDIINKDTDGMFTYASIDYPIYETGYIRADVNSQANLIWKIQREMAKSAGFKVTRSSFF